VAVGTGHYHAEPVSATFAQWHGVDRKVHTKRLKSSLVICNIYTCAKDALCATNVTVIREYLKLTAVLINSCLNFILFLVEVLVVCGESELAL